MNQIDLQPAATAAQIATRVRRSVELGEFAQAHTTISGSTFVGLSIVSVCAMAIATVLGSHDCRVKPIPLLPGQDADVSIVVPARTACTIRVAAGGATLDDLTVIAPPAHGALTPRGRTGVIYRPERGFRGEDAFVFSLAGATDWARISSAIRVQVTVK
jgi:hypothetical protein